MARDISIAISARDNFSSTITTMLNANRAFNKDLQGLQNRLDQLNKTKSTLKVDTDKAKQALKEAEKQFARTGEAADKMALELANADYENARRNLDLVSKNARQAEKDMLNLSGAISKTQNRAGSGGSGSSILGSLASAGFTKMAGDVMAQAANLYVGSALGNEAGSLFGGTLSGAASGAALGTMALGPGIGTAIGAAVGGAIGAAGAGLNIAASRDEAFKSVVQEQYSRVTGEKAGDLSAGSALAAQRETDSIAFSKLLGGQEQARDYLEWVKTTDKNTPFQYSDLTQMSKVLSTYGYSPEEMKEELIKIGDTGASLGLDTSSMSMVATSLGRMRSSNKTALEYLNPLVERGIPAIDYLADSLGKTKQQIYDMVSKGLIPGAEAAGIIADAMGEANQGAMEMQSKTFAGMMSTLEGNQAEMQNAMGEGYNQERLKGIAAQNEWFAGEHGDQMQEANRLIGQFQADLDNQREELLRKAQENALEQIQEQGLTGADAGRVLAEAKVKAEAEYMASDGYQVYLQSQKTLVGNLRTELSDSWRNFGHEMAQEFSKGLGAVRKEMAAALSPSDTMTIAGVTMPKPQGYTTTIYSNLPQALAAQNTEPGGSVQVSITGNEFKMSNEQDAEGFFDLLQKKLQEAFALLGK